MSTSYSASQLLATRIHITHTTCEKYFADFALFEYIGFESKCKDRCGERCNTVKSHF